MYNYHYDAHGNVVQLVWGGGIVDRDYYYDAFGVEQNADDNDANPFRYCGEQYDGETGNYYLRARYYTPGAGRFTQEDTHWNPGNMVYGDDPQKWNEYQSWLDESDRDDPLGLHTYTYKPEATAIAQAGNLYAYALNNSIVYYDPSGELAWPGEIHNQVVDHIAKQYQYYSEETIYYDIGWGRADLISPTGRVWEVKPNKARHISKGKEQLKKYVQNKWKRNPDMTLSTGGYIEPDSFWYTNASGTTTYFIAYCYAGEGVIVYDYTESTNWDRVGEISWSMLAALGSAALIVVSGGSYVPAY